MSVASRTPSLAVTIVVVRLKASSRRARARPGSAVGGFYAFPMAEVIEARQILEETSRAVARRPSPQFLLCSHRAAIIMHPRDDVPRPNDFTEQWPGHGYLKA
jgi:hypothetical protein